MRYRDKKNDNLFQLKFKFQQKHDFRNILLFGTLLLSFVQFSCKKFLDVEPPNSKILNKQVFESSEMANAALAGIYLDLYAVGFASGDASSIATLTALSADEVHTNLQTDPEIIAFETNQLLANNLKVLNLWISMYKAIYQAKKSKSQLINRMGI
ncbi:MAG: hypothetical protein EOO85_33760, partial [Pedobacter sp.]